MTLSEKIADVCRKFDETLLHYEPDLGEFDVGEVYDPNVPNPRFSDLDLPQKKTKGKVRKKKIKPSKRFSDLEAYEKPDSVAKKIWGTSMPKPKPQKMSSAHKQRWKILKNHVSVSDHRGDDRMVMLKYRGTGTKSETILTWVVTEILGLPMPDAVIVGSNKTMVPLPRKMWKKLKKYLPGIRVKLKESGSSSSKKSGSKKTFDDLLEALREFLPTDAWGGIEGLDLLEVAPGIVQVRDGGKPWLVDLEEAVEAAKYVASKGGDYSEWVSLTTPFTRDDL